jgi:hypothetical protein
METRLIVVAVGVQEVLAVACRVVETVTNTDSPECVLGSSGRPANTYQRGRETGFILVELVRGGIAMASFIQCRRKSDNTPIHINLDTVTWLRWNDDENFTAISWGRGEENIVRVWERPNEILDAHQEAQEGSRASSSVKNVSEP